MCGIAGFLCSASYSAEEMTFLSSSMANAIAHRGPDDSGTWVDHESGVAIASRRLAVIDLSPAGHQPMLSRSGRYAIVFNGEIYNHRDLRLRIESRNPEAASWRGHSDTETLLSAIESFGLEETLRSVVGMFAFALWDRSNRTLYLARDRLGEKPLYYGWQGGVFFFGSELKALAVHPEFSGEIDRNALTLLLRFGYIPAPWSIYRGIRKLPAGEFVGIPADAAHGRARETPEPRKYWSLRDAVASGRQKPFEGGAEDMVDALQDVLTRAIGGQMIADVPLGIFLSGGIDSSAVAALAQAQSDRPVRTFSIGFDDPSHNEAEYAKAVATHLRTDHNELYLSGKDALDIVPSLPVLYDEPFADSSQIPTALLTRMVRRNVTVALSGDGGDELFGGYRRYFLFSRIRTFLRLMPWPVRQLWARALTTFFRQGKYGSKAHKLARVMNVHMPEDIYRVFISSWDESDRVVRSASEPPSILESAVWRDAPEPISPMMELDTLSYLPDDILVKVDRAAMGTSLETRAPFLDHRVVEFAWRLPLAAKIKNGQGKWILRQMLYRFVPRELVNRRKQGFGVPLEAWLQGPLRDWAESLLEERRLREEGSFQPQPIRHAWNEFLNGNWGWGYRLWIILMFQAWREHWQSVVDGKERSSTSFPTL